MHRMYRYLVVITTVAVLSMGMAIPAFAGPAGSMASRINSSRAAAGLAPLETYWDLTDDAVAQAARMLDRGEIYHNPNLGGVTSVWQGLGENVGMGVDLAALHSAFMASSSHRANILGDYNYVGVGVKTDGDGVSWVTVVFMKAASGLNAPPPTTTTTTAPQETTTTTTPPSTTTTPPGTTTTTTTPPSSTTTTSTPAAATTTQRATGTQTAVRASSDTTDDQSPANSVGRHIIGHGLRTNIWI